MAASSIRHTRYSRTHRSPVLLDQRSLMRISFVMALMLVIIFMSGYVVGVRKVEARLDSPAARVVLELPSPVTVAVEDTGPHMPARSEPGEYIDVDIADKHSSATLPAGEQVATSSHTAEAVKPVSNQVVDDKPPEAINTAVITEENSIAIGGPAASDPGQFADSEISALFDNATPDNARYSIQVGMYSLLDNAERRVKELASRDLSAYIDEYLNDKNEPRYNVRFGYFADHRSARVALDVFEQKLAGSGYVVKLQTALAVLN